MPILHIRITKNEEIINLDSGIYSQNFTFKRAVIIKDTGTSTYDYRGGVTISLDFLQGGTEFKSNINTDEISIPFDDSNKISDVRWDLNMSTEDVSRSFLVKVFNYDKQGALPPFDVAGTAGEIKYIDLYFQYNTNLQTNIY
jgi:hypothetical protein